eukprot:CAMPEP_0202367516 /NCGR_PEP_ID=MMETSP1126-20121109/17691_1 /ASSEMBLY_ACC=CAM_ASM_000457 /TAXON_ID=3047 /ORGANISM="Dunaliella tertiolecta, Strain CCMP1320" /LENGTH=233 /DNA_ID=CAMNT_0048962771 /DNA_START=540 /DNA_END=1242 /DNA_ORIENTATION=+
MDNRSVPMHNSSDECVRRCPLTNQHPALLQSPAATSREHTGRLPEKLPPPPAPAKAEDAAELVRKMMAAPPGTAAAQAGPAPGATAAAPPGPPTSGLTLQEKRKLLWGKKSAPAAADGPNAAAAPAGAPGAGAGDQQQQSVPEEAVYGSNRWDVANFSSEAERARFLRIMGIRSHTPPAQSSLPPEQKRAIEDIPGHTAMTKEEQERVLQEVEQAWLRARAQGKATTGLGAAD